MKVCNRIISFSLAIAIVISFAAFVPVKANASSGSGLIYDLDSVDAMNAWLGNNSIITPEWSFANIKSQYWNVIDGCTAAAGLGAFTTEEKLASAASTWNKVMRSPQYWPAYIAYGFMISGNDSGPWVQLDFDDSLGVFRLREMQSGVWLTNSAGHFPYYRPETVDDNTGTEIYRTGQWIDASNFTDSSALWHVVSNYELNEFREQWLDVMPNASIVKSGSFYWLTASTYGKTLVLCDKYGYPYYLPADGETAITTPNNYYNDVTNQYTPGTPVHYLW